ncbi:hypothetical protein C8R45DRAFT_1044970 [Mycena sanguinolenta]|nr:hypothetical protein C8R45DRAFT_1044970 [Mycena sanguinolenta]
MQVVRCSLVSETPSGAKAMWTVPRGRGAVNRDQCRWAVVEEDENAMRSLGNRHVLFPARPVVAGAGASWSRRVVQPQQGWTQIVGETNGNLRRKGDIARPVHTSTDRPADSASDVAASKTEMIHVAAARARKSKVPTGKDTPHPPSARARSLLPSPVLPLRMSRHPRCEVSRPSSEKRTRHGVETDPIYPNQPASHPACSSFPALIPAAQDTHRDGCSRKSSRTRRSAQGRALSASRSSKTERNASSLRPVMYPPRPRTYW